MIVGDVNPCLGAVVTGVDVRRLGEDEFALLHEAFLQRSVLVLRDQFLDAESLLRFTERWGEVYTFPWIAVAPDNEDFPEVKTLANRGKAHAETEVWHADVTFLREPVAHAILAAQAIPDVGGDTMFANQYAAYEGLSTGLKAMLSGLKAVHEPATTYAKATVEGFSETKAAVHPVVRTHPETGRKSLFVNPYWTTRFDGMTPAESRGLLQYLFEQAVMPEYCYRHQWQPGDVVMWDNRCLLHYAVHDFGDAERTMIRTTIAGDAPK